MNKSFDSITNKITKAPQITISSGPVKPEQVNLLRIKRKSGAKKIFKRVLLAIVFVIIILGGAVILRAANLSQKIFVGQKTTFFAQVINFIRGGGNNDRLIGEDLGQINILLLGIGGEGHDGPYLSDTIILAQVRPDIGTVALISIPRDYLATLPGNLGQQKINAAFSAGYTKNKDWNEGGQYARQAVEQLSGLKIPYFAVIDFAGFEQAIKDVNGIDVHIDRTFTDYSYPDSGIGYLSPITFTAGNEHMNATRALQFARSRHAEGPEGSDFARSARQQKIIEAFKQKILKLNLITDAGKINLLLGTFADHFHTNITPGELFHVYDLVKTKQINKTLSADFDPTTSLICPKIMEDTGAYVLVPCDGKTETDVKNFFKNIFSFGKINAEKSVIWLSTSTGDRTAYNNASTKLKEAGLTVWELPYNKVALSQNIFYQANPKPATAEFIKNTLNAAEATLPPPGINADKNKVDVIIILGENH